jgi:hypothetical protein
MNHPDQQDWISYLYREADRTTRARLETHLADCETCRSQLDQWKTVQQHLDTWRLPGPARIPRPSPAFPRIVRWAVAALLMITIGFALGRSSDPSPEDIAALRQELKAELAELVDAQIAESTTFTLAAAQEHNVGLMREFLDYYRAERSAENKALSTVLSRLDASRNADFLSLRKDLETVALNSDVGLRQTQQQLFRLADYSQPHDSAPSN